MVEWKKLGEVFEIRNGYTPSKSHPEYWEGGTIPWFRMEDIRLHGRILSDSIQHITELGIKKSGLFPANSIIVATTATIGEHALLIADSLANQQFTALTCRKSLKQSVIPRFAYYYFFLLDEWCKQHTNVSGFASVDMEGFKRFPFPIPSLEEQERIVGILDTFTASIDNIKAQIEQRRKQYEHYRNTLLTFNKDDDSVEWKTLGEVGDISAGGDVPRNTIKETNPIENYCFPVYSNGKENNSLYGYSTSYSIAKQAVTISARGTIGWHCVREAYFTPIIRLITVIPDEKLLSAKYLDYALYVTRIGGDNGGIPQLTVPSIKNCEIPLPSLQEQQRIVSILDTFEASINNLEAQLEQRQKQYEYYREELLTF